jgi:hypothetical protein
MAIEACLYAQDCSEGPAVTEGEQGDILVEDAANGLTGCCDPIGGVGRVDVAGFSACATEDTVLYLLLHEQPLCGAYTIEVGL